MPIGRGRILPPGVDLRRLPSEDSERTHHAPADAEVEIVRARDEDASTWVRVRLPDGREGWLAYASHALAPFPTARIAEDGAILRTLPDEASPPVVRLRRGAPLMVVATGESPARAWVRVRLSTDREGWVPGSTQVTWDATMDEQDGGPPAVPRAHRIPGQILFAMLVAVTGIVTRAVLFLARVDRHRGRTGAVSAPPRHGL